MNETRQPLLAEGGRPLEEFLAAIGEPRYRAAQIRRWVFRRGAASFEEMTDLALPLRSRLGERFRVFSCETVQTAESEDGTARLVLRLLDGETIESVLIVEGARVTACVSSQAGCPVGCPFCASGLLGTKRNLADHEIVEQILLLRRRAEAYGGLTHIVFMGIGEPLLNFENLEGALLALHAEDGVGMAARRITLSTVAPAGKIPRLENIPLPINLAISLHAPTDELRDRLVPGNAGIAPLIEAAVRYRRNTGRQVTFEYVLLAERLAGTGCSVNLIPFNPVPGTGFHPPSAEAVRAFRHELARRDVPVTQRKRKGRSVEAACGQLRRNRIEETTRAACSTSPAASSPPSPPPPQAS